MSRFNPNVAPAPLAADVGVVAALPIEVAPFLAKLGLVRRFTTPRGTVVEGELGGKVVAVVLAGAGRKLAQRGAELLVNGHRPRWLVSAGFAGALAPDLRRDDVVLATEVQNQEGARFAIDVAVSPAQSGSPSVRAGRLLTVDAIVRTAAEKAELHARTGATIVDMETSSVAAYAAERSIRFLSVRVVSDEAGTDLPPEVVAILGGTGGVRLGAAVGAIWKRPSSLKDLWALRDHAKSAADRLAGFLAGALPGLPP